MKVFESTLRKAAEVVVFQGFYFTFGSSNTQDDVNKFIILRIVHVPFPKKYE